MSSAQSGNQTRRAVVMAAVVPAIGALLTGVAERGASADVTAVRGEACGYYLNIGLFGGPKIFKGAARPGVPPITAPNTTPPSTVTSDMTWSPHVALPQSGTATPIARSFP